MENFFRKWKNVVAGGQPAAVATVFGGLGARPRENGAQMLILPDGGIVGTVGGGRLEADVIACAQAVLKDGETRIHHFILTGMDASKSDMICGGTGDVLIYHSGRQDETVLDQMVNLLELNGRLYFPVDSKDGILYIPESGPVLGCETIIKELEEESQLAYGERDVALLCKMGRRYLVQKVKAQGVLHIMGAGHVSLEIAKIAAIAGMDCVVYDDRAEYLGSKRFPEAKSVLLQDMAFPPLVAASRADMIAIVTRGHLYDMENLQWALNTNAGYIGMIGSLRKSTMIFQKLLYRGFSQSRLNEVHTPIGLDIGALTPQEIAVAIVAELIAFKRGKLLGIPGIADPLFFQSAACESVCLSFNGEGT
jgi:xanthine dehydrogenase accessory factor